MNNLQRTGGIASITLALIYITMFIFYGALLKFPEGADIAQKLDYLKQNQLWVFVMNGIGYILFGIVLVILIQALHSRLNGSLSNLTGTASIFGFVWAVIIIAAGMIANLGLQSLLNLSVSEPEQVRSVWLANEIVVSGLGGGIEITGGLWVLLSSIAAFRNGKLSKGLNLLGILVGAIGVLTLYHPSSLFKEMFGLTQIIWFIWLGIHMLGKH